MISKIMNINKDKKLLLSLVFAIVVFFAIWRVCETASLIFIDDVMYANWTKHGVKYFFEQISWHYENFNGRTFIHVFLALILSFKEHLYAILMPFCIFGATFMVFDIIEIKTTIKTKLFVCGFVGVMFLSLSWFYLSSTLIWMSGGINYIFPLFVVILGYWLYTKSFVDKKYLISSIIISFLAGATTEQYGMYMIGMYVLTLFFVLIDKESTKIKNAAILLVSSAIGYTTIFMSNGTSTRVSGFSGLQYFEEQFVLNSGLLVNNGLFVIIIAIILFLLAITVGLYNKKFGIISTITTCIYTTLVTLGFYGLSGVILLLYIAGISIFFLSKKELRNIGKLFLCGYGTFFMINIAYSTGSRNFIPFLLTYIVVISCILIHSLLNNKNNKMLPFFIVITFLFCSINSISFISNTIGTEKEFNNIVYKELRNADDSIITIDFDNIHRNDSNILYRHTTPFDTAYGPDLKYYYDYFGYSDDVVYHHTSDIYDLSDVSLNGKPYIEPIINKDDKAYVPYMMLTYIDGVTRANFYAIKEIADDVGKYIGCYIDNENFYAISSTGLMSTKDGNVIYLNQNADIFTYPTKGLDLVYIEISQFCEWADATYAYDSNTDTYNFVIK